MPATQATKEKMSPVFSLAASAAAARMQFCTNEPTEAQTRIRGFNLESTTYATPAVWLSSTLQPASTPASRETAVAKLVQRYYTSVLGRFMTPDPYSPAPDGAAKLTEPGTWNHYSYTADEPINRADPSGQSFCDPEALLDPGCFTAGGSFGTVNPLWASFLTNLAAQIAAQIKAAAAALQAQPEQCDITLMGASAVIPGGPALHLWLQITVSDPNTGFSQTGVLEANAVSKSDPTQPATKWQLLTGQAWLNGGFSTTPLKGSGQMIYNFDQEYSNDALCAFVTLLGIDSGAYKNNTVTYNPLSPNSNSHIAYMLSEAGIQLPAGIAFELFFIAPGFYGVMPSNP